MSNYLTFQIEKTVAWRIKKADRFPEDGRNTIAIELLQKLAAERGENEDLFTELSNIESDVDDPRYDKIKDAYSEVLRSVGFSFIPSCIDEVASEVLMHIND